MHPVLFEVGGVTVYSYGFMIALGSVAGVVYMAVQGKKDVGLTFDQANSLFLFIFISAVVGGKVFLFFEDPARFSAHPLELSTGRGFVFYGSFLFAIPTMYVFFRWHKLPPYAMLDVMAVTTCLVHAFGRVGCFMAGCCYGLRFMAQSPTYATTSTSKCSFVPSQPISLVELSCCVDC
jgi:phosphatidylglycerol:prolipoprotein diacylglycerol transferase